MYSWTNNAGNKCECSLERNFCYETINYTKLKLKERRRMEKNIKKLNESTVFNRGKSSIKIYILWYYFIPIAFRKIRNSNFPVNTIFEIFCGTNVMEYKILEKFV